MQKYLTFSQFYTTKKACRGGIKCGIVYTEADSGRRNRSIAAKMAEICRQVITGERIRRRWGYERKITGEI